MEKFKRSISSVPFIVHSMKLNRSQLCERIDFWAFGAFAHFQAFGIYGFVIVSLFDERASF